MRETINIRKIFFLLFLVVMPFMGFSQVSGSNTGARVLTGVVRNAQGPMSQVAVTLINENNRQLGGDYTKDRGEFYIRIPAGTQNVRISFSYLGYKSQFIAYSGQPSINITLADDPMSIKTVRVVDKAVKKNEMGIPVENSGSARQKVDMADLDGIPATSVADALYGAMTGVDIVATSGDPGAKSSIRIRGTGSLNASNEPLFVVDGIPYEPPTVSDDFNYTTADENDFGALLNITPSDIESIEVLMDAMAVMAWGPKGANGVLLITTKSGTSGRTKFQITERFDYNWEPTKIPLLDGKQYVTLIQDAMWNRMGDVGYTWLEMDKLTKAPEINYDPSYIYFKEYSSNTDWLDEVRQDAYTNDFAFNMNGGGDRARYTFSLTNTMNQGTTIGTKLDRLTARLKVNYNFSDRFRVTASIDYTQNKSDGSMPYQDGSYITVSAPGPRAIAEIKMPNMSPYRIDDNGNRTSEYFVPVAYVGYDPFQGVFQNKSSMMYNPVAMVKEATNKLTQQTINVVYNMQYDIIPEALKYSADVSLRLMSSSRRTFLPSLATGVASSSNFYNLAFEGKSDNMYMYFNNQLTYSKYFNEDRSTALYVAQKFNIEDSRGTSYDENASGMADVSMADPVTGGLVGILKSGTSQSRSVMSVSSVNFTYKQRYSATAGWSLGGSTKLGPKARWTGFPTTSIVWHIGNEKFMSSAKSTWLDEARLSASWGKSGRGPTNDFSYIGSFSALGDYMGQSAVAPSSIQADHLKMEVNRQLNIQTELNIFKLFYLKVAYYDKKDVDQLQQNATIPSTTGFSTVSWFNSGAAANKGVNVEFNVKNVLKNKNWKLTGGATFSFNKNTILELPANKTYDSYSFGNGNYARNVTLNNPIGSLYGYKSLGIYQTYDDIIARDKEGGKIYDILGNPIYTSINGISLHPGDAKYEDMNYDGVIDKYDIVYLGNSQPTVFSGQNVSVKYKNVQLDVRGYLRLGNKVINRARISTESMYDSNNQSTAVLSRWRHEGDDTTIPRALYGRGYNYLGSDRFVDDASYFRIKQVTVTYFLGANLSKKLGLTPGNTKIYATGYDLFTITEYSGQNPEVGLGSGLYPVSEDSSKTPRPIKITLGLSIDF